MRRVLAALFVISICAQVGNAHGQTPIDRRGVVELLAGMSSVNGENSPLGKLFQVGDSRIEDLVLALDNPDKRISLNAQVVIRYLGNGHGMQQLLDWYAGRDEVITKGPIPLPLNEWDYKFIKNQYLSVTPSLWVNAESYIYALALDDTPRARMVFNEMARKLGQPDVTTPAGRAMIQVASGHPKRIVKGELAHLALRNYFFIPREDRKYARTRLISYNGSKNKALVEIYINRGVLAEEWYHVVFSKNRSGWKFYSITQVAMS